MKEDRIAKTLKERREELGYTQQEIADETRMELQQYQRYEHGTQLFVNARMKLGLRICAALELDPFELCFEDGEDIAGVKKK